jgi:hypothetical protein
MRADRFPARFRFMDADVSQFWGGVMDVVPRARFLSSRVPGQGAAGQGMRPGCSPDARYARAGPPPPRQAVP